MKKLLWVALALGLVAGGLPAQAKSKAQFDTKKGQYKIEAGAKLTLGFDNDAYGQALVALWDKVHPEAAGQVEYLNTGSGDAAKRLADLQGDAPDVVMSVVTDVPKFAGAFAVIPPELKKMAGENLDASFYKTTQALSKDLTALPLAYDGMSFAWNKTMLTQLKLITGKVTKDNLPVEFDTWEKIFALSKSWAAKRPTYLGKPVNIVFPMSLDEVWSGYSSLTAAGWQLFQEGDALKPGFEKDSFLKGLEFIKAASDAKISVEANGALTPGASMNWRWDAFLNEQSAPFGLVGTWMDIKGATVKGGHELQFSPMPTWKGQRLTPLLQAKVVVVNAYSRFPSAAAELLRLVYTKEGLQAMVENSGYVPTLKNGAKIAPDFSKEPVKGQMLAAFQTSTITPVTLKFPANAQKQAMDLYYNIGMNQFFKDIWDGAKTPAAAQTEAVSAAAKYIEEQNKK